MTFFMTLQNSVINFMLLYSVHHVIGLDLSICFVKKSISKN